MVAIPSFELFSPDDLQVDSTSFGTFLNRARTEREQGRDVPARIALGAYLGARLVDRCLKLTAGDDEQEGFRWQLESTRKFLDDLPAGDAEVSHLLGIIDAITSPPKHRDTVLRMALVAYGYFLEYEARLEEALEVLGLSARTYRADLPLVDAATLSLFVARLNRMLARWDRATRAYAMAEQAGLEARDLSTVMLARIGRANTMWGQGNLPAARAALEAVVAETDSPELFDCRGRALSDLSVVLERQGYLLEAIRTRYDALRTLRDEVQRTRAFGDLGITLRMVGEYDAARRSLEIVMRSDAGLLLRANSCLEMMELESAVGNRMAFERYRQEARTFEDRMPPSMAIDYRYKVGIGFARFGKEAKARSMLREALALSEAHGLNQWYFKVDRVLNGLALCEEQTQETAATTESSEVASAAAEIVAGLLELTGV